MSFIKEIMKIKILFFALLFSSFTWGQTTLLNESFGTTNGVYPTGWTSSNVTNGYAASTLTPSTGYAGVSGSVNARFINTGTNGVVHTLIYSNSLSTVGYSSVTVLWGGRATGTFTQPVTFEWSPDGFTWNAVTYTQVASTATWTLVNGGTPITLPAGAAGIANLRFRFSTTSNNNGNYSIDDFLVVGYAPSSYSGVTAGAGAEPATISSLTNTVGAASLNFDFLVTDDANTVAANDALPTLISQIIIPQGTGNDIPNWTQAIAGAQLTDGTNTINGTINTTNITFSGINTATLGNVADGGTKTYTVKIWLLTTLLGGLPATIDGFNFAFKIDRTNFTTASTATSTQFETGAGTVVESGSTNNEVTVVTTRIVCTNTPGATQYVNTNFATLPTVQAQDANGNLDLNYASNVTITNAGSLGMSNVPTAFSAGVLTFPANFQYTAAGNGTLTIAENPSAGITDGVTTAITVLTPTPEINVKGLSSLDILDNDISPSATDGTIFTSAIVGSTSIRTFTIQNLGTGPLTISSISFSGTNASCFAVTTAPSSPIAAGGSTTFTVTFTPNATGVLTATLTINNDDSNEAVYDYAIQGTGNASVASDVFGIAASIPTTISSTINTPAPLSSTTGIQVWQLEVRDGGVGLNDADNLPTILTSMTFAQAAVNDVGTWTDAINTIALFDGVGTAPIATGVVTANQVQFTGMNISVPDNTKITLTVRLSLKCPLGADAFDGEDIAFSLTGTNTIFSPSGSGRLAGFATQSTPNLKNTIAVVADRLAFAQQPSTTGVGSPMTSVIIKATDACGNTDTGYTGSVSITSTGTMTGAPLTTTFVSGVATFSGIVHTVIANTRTLTTSSALPAAVSNPFDIVAATILKQGDIAVLAVNTNTGGSGLDEVAFVCFQDIIPGTTIYITDNGYEREFANQWGGTEGVVSITRTGTTLPKGTILVFESTTANVMAGTHFDIYTCGAIDTNWTKSALSGGSIGGFNLNSNDDMYILQGGTWTNDTSHHSTYTGNVVYGWTESGWHPAPSAGTCNSVSNDVNNCTAWSTLYPRTECFNTLSPLGNGKVKFDDPNNPDFSTLTNGRYDWIALINNSANWVSYPDNATYNAGGYDYKNGCSALTIATNTYVDGKWTGKVDTNWFNCGNWDTLTVPDETVDVLVPDTSYNNQAKIDATATYASNYGNIAKSKNLTITGEKVEIIANSNNKLEVHGNLLIDSAGGALDMDDSNAGTADGQIYLYGNWTNNMGNAAFQEGNGTVQFVGATPQIINAVTPEGTETFYNVVLDNNFDTAVSNDLRTTNLTVNSGKAVSVDANGYILVDKKLSNNGDFVIENNGQLVQVDETDTNDGTYTGTKFQVKRTAQVKHFDYVYWCSPTDNFPVNSLPGNNRYEWDTLYPNLNGTLGYWVPPTTATMTKGKGYIARASNGASTPQAMNIIFNDKPHNGQFTYPITRGTYAGPDYDADPGNATNADTTKYDDNWNFVGNPYPSAIDAEEFLVLNQTKIEGSVWLWKHGFDPAATPSPFYTNYLYNYSTADLIKYNGLGSTEPDTFAGQIASGQGFLVNMKDSAPEVGSTITFNNSLRSGSIAANGLYNNSIFYRNANTIAANARPAEEKSRIWLDIINPTSGQMERTLVGYSTYSTLEKDHMYDCFHTIKTELSIYSLIEAKPFIIQGRPLPFDNNDVVPLGVKIVNAGNHTIAIKKVDGLFTNLNQHIYIEDKQLNIIHDLKQAPYTFSSQPGQFDGRFVLRYTNEFLGNEDFQSAGQNVVVGADKNEIAIKSYSENISGLTVYDVLGREVFVDVTVNDTSFTINSINPTHQVLLIKIKLANGQTVTKKILF